MPYDGPVMVLVMITNFEVQKILVNSGNTKDILFYQAFQKMKLPSDRLVLARSLLYKFTEESIMPKGTITLFVLMGTHPRQFIMMVEFLVLKVPSTYNAIIS